MWPTFRNHDTTVPGEQAVPAAKEAMSVGGGPVTEGIGGRSHFGFGQLYQCTA